MSLQTLPVPVAHPSLPGAPKLKRISRSVARQVCRAYPLLSGCTQLANLRFLAGMTDEDELVEDRLRDGSIIRLQLNDYGGRSMYYFGDYDPKITRILQRVLRRGDHVIDIGANFGLISLLSAKLVGPTGSVHAFEPQTTLASLISQSAAANNYSHLVTHPVGLSDTDGVVDMFTEPGVTGAASLVRDDKAHLQRTSVRVVAAGNYLTGLGLPRTRLLKIDVEGHEHTVLESAKEFLTDTPPEAILFETQDAEIPLRKRPVASLLASLGYIFYPICKSTVRLKLYRDDELTPERGDSAHDVLAIHSTSNIRV